MFGNNIVHIYGVIWNLGIIGYRDFGDYINSHEIHSRFNCNFINLLNSKLNRLVESRKSVVSDRADALHGGSVHVPNMRLVVIG
jgi:hypothetical protein